MCNCKHKLLGLALLLVIFNFGCSNGEAQMNKNAPVESSATPAAASGAAKTGVGADAQPVATPASKFTAADIAKLKWIEGTWRGMDGDKPFFERYKLEGTTLVVQGLKEDGSADGPPERFELKNGEFGKGEAGQRSAASEITDTYVQFVPGPGKTEGGRRNSFRFEREPNGWTATLEWPASADKPAQQKVYKMEPWQPEK